MKASALINAYFVEVSNTQSSVVSMLWDSCSVSWEEHEIEIPCHVTTPRPTPPHPGSHHFTLHYWIPYVTDHEALAFCIMLYVCIGVHVHVCLYIGQRVMLMSFSIAADISF